MTYVETMLGGYLPWAYTVLFFVSLGANAAIIIIFRRLSKLGRCLDDLTAVQSMHLAPTPRVGALAFVAGILALYPLALVIDVNVKNLSIFLSCLIPVVATGLMEDLGYHVSPRARLAASVLSGALVVYFFGPVIDRSGIAPLDAALVITPLAITMVSCVRNAFAPFGIANYFRGKISETICAVERSIVKLFFDLTQALDP
jgi:UDP-N-acetylmuramyl pentapeptide phosphotransferase/UDP-N-acetylglucosamine-1-phosphate transferase